MQTNSDIYFPIFSIFGKINFKKIKNTDETSSPVCWLPGNCPINFYFTHTRNNLVKFRQIKKRKKQNKTIS